MFTTDAHCDTLYRIAIDNCPPARCAVTEEHLAAGEVGVQTFAMFSSLRRPDPHGDGLRMKALYERLPYRHLDGTLDAQPPQVPSCVLSIEGGEMLRGSLEALDDFDGDVRLRLIALTWNFENEIGTPARVNAVDGLKPFGFTLLREMDRRGIAADVSHLNEACFWDVIRRCEVAPLASHSNCRWLCDTHRNLRKSQVKALIERKGFIGVNFYPPFLAKDRRATLEDAARHIDAICQMGGEDIVGFGSDFDGIDSWPEELASPADFPRLLNLLDAWGYSRAQLEKIAGLNYWRFLRDAQAVRH